MRLCYVDEAGCTGMLPSSTSPIQPVFVLAGVVIPLEKLPAITTEFLHVKQRFFPDATAAGWTHLDRVLLEVKGAELRRDAISPSRRKRRHAFGFLDNVVRLLREYDARVFARVWVKGLAAPIDSTAIYTYSVQDMCSTFQAMLFEQDRRGFVIADSRNKSKNEKVAHSIFTQKFRNAGDAFSRVLEMPTFGHSNNHVGLQLADLLCSAFLFPMATVTYCLGHVDSVHVQPDYVRIRDRYGAQLRALQFRYRDPGGRWRGGITVSDKIGNQGSALMLRAATTAAVDAPTAA